MEEGSAVPSHVKSHNRNDSDITQVSRFSGESTRNPSPSKRFCSFNFLPKLKKSLLSWRKKDKNKKLVLPLTVEEKEKKKEKKKKRRCCWCILIIILIWFLLGNIIALDVVYFRSPVLQTNNITTLLNGNNGNESDTNSPASAPEQNIKALACLSLYESMPPKEFNCGFCADSQAFYNVTTFCALRFIWGNALNQTVFENLRWMQDKFYCNWAGVTCDDSKNIIGLDLSSPFTVTTFDFSLGDLKTLKRLTIGGNGRLPFGILPPKLFQSETLEELILIFTGLNGPLPNTFDKMTSLKNLQIKANLQLNGTIPDTIGSTSLETFIYSDSILTGVIPDFIGNSKTLQNSLSTLDFSGNQFTGKIPDSLMNLSKLKAINFNRNFLSGEPFPSLISAKFANVLVALDVSFNGLSGTMPPSVNQFVNLVDLNIQNNSFTGSIPTEFSSIKKLNSLLFTNNQLSGSIPNSIGDIYSCNCEDENSV